MNKKKSATPLTMEELLALAPDTGFTKGVESNEDAEYVASHPEEWNPIFLSSRGRPKRGKETGSVAKSVRLPQQDWDCFQELAEASGLTIHAAIRQAMAEWAGAKKKGEAQDLETYTLKGVTIALPTHSVATISHVSTRSNARTWDGRAKPSEKFPNQSISYPRALRSK